MRVETIGMPFDANPFPPSDPDRHAIWEMLVRRDIEGFLACDWSIFADCFRAEGFLGIDANGSLDPQDWRPAFPTPESYRDAWLQNARRADATAYGEDRRSALYRATNITDIRLEANAATARKTFDDAILLADGGQEILNWQSLFFCAKARTGRWEITGFVGFLPFETT